jgi:hypothetical protein
MSHKEYTVADMVKDLTPRSRLAYLTDHITPSKAHLPRLLPLHITPPPKSPTRLPLISSSSPPPPPVGSPLPSFGSSPFEQPPSFGSPHVRSQRPVSLDELSENMSRIQLPPLNENYETCMKGCKRTCRTKHPRAGGGTNRRRKNRKQKGTRRHGSRRYRR